MAHDHFGRYLQCSEGLRSKRSDWWWYPRQMQLHVTECAGEICCGEALLNLAWRARILASNSAGYGLCRSYSAVHIFPEPVGGKRSSRIKCEGNLHNPLRRWYLPAGIVDVRTKSVHVRIRETASLHQSRNEHRFSFLSFEKITVVGYNGGWCYRWPSPGRDRSSSRRRSVCQHGHRDQSTIIRFADHWSCYHFKPHVRWNTGTSCTWSNWVYWKFSATKNIPSRSFFHLRYSLPSVWSRSYSCVLFLHSNAVIPGFYLDFVSALLANACMSATFLHPVDGIRPYRFEQGPWHVPARLPFYRPA